MPKVQTIRIVCDVRTYGDSLSGRVTRQDGEHREFTGWLGLLGALQALLPGTEPDGSRTEVEPE